ncbi:MAG: hypothetical protein Q8P41_25445 [Pseudomonadota bacterium]|nr:hypothetical protein [Pseudomonadota bacterium]
MLVLLLACARPAADTGAPADTATSPVWDGPTAPGTGVAVNFSIEGGGLAGADVSTLEVPTSTTVTAADGAFALDVPAGGDATFVLTHPDMPPVQTATLDVDEAGIEGVTFQVPDWVMYDLMEAFAGVETEDGTCQIATTVTCAGCDMWHGAFHGQAGATVTIEPALPAASGPVYFYRNAENGIIWPDPTLTETTDDGGVLFLNVPPGTYVLTAHQDGVTFEARRMWCREGWLVNASPPYGLQAY